MTVKQIIKEYIQANGYDGLYCEGTCSCNIDELMECAYEGMPYCEPGYYRALTQDEKNEGYKYSIGNIRG
jgi:hypothetical protein